MKLFRNSEGGKAGSLDGVNLFFGALLGANLGTLDHVPLFDYVKLVILLAGTVMTIRMMSTSRERRRVLLLVLFYVILISALLLLPDFRPEGMNPQDLNRLVATLAIWIGSVLLIELSPVQEDSREPAASEPPQA